MARVRPLVIAPPAIMLGLVLLFAFGLGRDDPDQLPSALAGNLAPPLSVTALRDDPAPGLDDLRAPGMKLVNFWASWCGPCRIEHPHLTALAAEGVTIIGVNYKDEPADALAFLAELGDPYASIGADPTGRTGIDWGLYGVPETFVLDGEGRIVMRHAGPITEAVLASRLRPAMQAAAAASPEADPDQGPN